MNKPKNGFTLVEIMIVVIIVLVLAGAAVGGTRSILKTLKFQNIFNQLVFMTQEARNLAITVKDKTAENYSANFNMTATPPSVTVVLTNIDASTSITESYTFPDTTTKLITAPSCTTSAIIKYTASTGATSITCDGTAQKLIEIGIEDNEGGSKKTFSIHQAAGIPQVN